VQDIQTRFVSEGDEVVINGRKGYCTGSLYAHWLGVLALNADDKAHLAFVPRRTPGLTVVDDWSSIGQRNTASGTVLAENLRVPAFNVFKTYQS
jgi:alkylation response protein AidB-like acyl-CoA dehydrogenase